NPATVLLDTLSAWRVPLANAMEFSVAPWLSAADPSLVGAALRALRYGPEPALRAQVDAATRSSDTALSDAAIRAALVMNSPDVLNACRQRVQSRAANPRLCLALLALHGEPSDLGLVLEACSRPESRRDALWALGYSGHALAAEHAFASLADE